MKVNEALDELTKGCGSERKKKLKRCVGHVKAQGKDESSAYAICQTSVKGMDMENDLNKAGKSGEGSRGGKVIGHTRSGKPIYDNPSHEGHKNFDHNDHAEAANLHRDLYRMTSPDLAHHGEREAHRAAFNAHVSSGREKLDKQLSKTTYKQAHEKIRSALKSNGWKTTDGLKYNHATSPDNKHRIYFTAQSMHHSFQPTGSGHSMNLAHSMHDDSKKISMMPDDRIHSHLDRVTRARSGELDVGPINRSFTVRDIMKSRMPDSLIIQDSESDSSLSKAIKDGDVSPATLSRSGESTLLKSDQSFDLTKAAGESKEDQAAEEEDDKEDTEESITKEQMGKAESALDELCKGCGGSKKKRKKELESMKSECQPVIDEITAAINADDFGKAYIGFKKLTQNLSGKVDNPKAVAASIGRKKYGKGAFQQAAAAGRKMGQKSVSSVGEALDDLTKGYGDEYLIDTHSESHHTDVDKQVIAWLTQAAPINPYDESHNQTPQKIDPARPGYTQERSFLIHTR